jgi:hypothetical protein
VEKTMDTATTLLVLLLRLYDNAIDFGVQMISPIASNAFSYYNYKLESTFFDENKKDD